MRPAWARATYRVLPDALYRKAASQIIATLVEENRQLRRRPYRRAHFLTSLLADALGKWAKSRSYRGGSD